MRIGWNHLMVLLLLPAFWYFSSDTSQALKLFGAYLIVFYFPGYLLSSILLAQYPPAFRTICGIFLGVAALPQLLYYLSLFSNPVAYHLVVFLGILSAALSAAKDTAEERG